MTGRTVSSASRRSTYERALHVSEALHRVVEWLFYVILALLPIDVYLTLPGHSSGVFLSEVLVAQASVLVACCLILYPGSSLSEHFGLRWIDVVPLGLIVVAGLVSTLGAQYKGVAFRDCSKYAFYLGVYVVARITASRPRARQKALISIVLGFGLVVGLGIMFNMPGMPNIPRAVLNIQQVQSYLPNTAFPRAVSTFRYSDELEGYLVLALPMIIVCAVKFPSRFVRLSCAILAIAGVWLLILTYTRSAYLVALVVVPLLLYFLGGKRLALVGTVTGAVIGCGILVLDHNIATRALSLFSGSTNGYGNRLTIWSWALQGLPQHLLFGLGPRHLELQPNAPWSDLYHGRRETNAENSYLNVLVDMGIVGAAALLVCVVAAIRRMVSVVRQRGEWYDDVWNVGAFVGTVAVLLDAVVHPTFYSSQVTGLLCGLIGLAGVAWPLAARQASSPGVPLREDALPEAHVVAPHDENVAHAFPTNPSPPSGTDSAPLPDGNPLALSSRIVFLLNSAGMGGAQMVSVHLASGLQQRGASVLIVCPPRASELIDLVKSKGLPYQTCSMGVSVGRWRGWLGTTLFFVPGSHRRFDRLVANLAAERPSIFVAPFLREQLLLARLGLRRDIQVIWTLHSPLHYVPHRLLLHRLQKRLARAASAIIAISQSQAAEWVRSHMPSSRVHIIRNGIPDASFAVHRSRSHPGGVSTYRIGFISRLTEGKGAQFLCRALPRVLLRHPNTTVVIAGTGRYEGRLRRLVGALGLREHVQFLGFVSDVPALLHTLDLVVLPTVDKGEVVPTVLLEASAAGVPVIASDLPGIREQVLSGTTGILITPGNTEQLASAICDVLADPHLAQSMGEQGQAYVQSQYALSRTGAQFFRLLYEVEVLREESPGEVTRTSLIALAARRAHFLGQTALYLLSKVLSAAATAVWTVLAASALSQTAYGDLMLGMGMLDIFAAVNDAGITTLATSEAARSSPAELPALTGSVIQIKVALGACSTLVAVGAAFVAPFSPEAKFLLLLIAPSLIFSSMLSLSLLFRARSMLWQIVAVISCVSIASIAVTVYIAVGRGTAVSFALIQLGTAVLSGFLMLLLVVVKFRPRLRPDFRKMARMIISAFPYGVSLALVYLYYRLDVPLLAVLGNTNEVAVYTSAYRILDVITLLPAAASGIALAEMAKLVKEPDRRHLMQFTQQYLELALVIGLLIVVFLSVSGREILTLLYRGRYDDSYPALYILGWAGAASLVTNVFLPLVSALGRRRVLIFASLFALVVNVSINVVLIPQFGPVGAAYATLCTEVVVIACYAFVAIRELRWRLKWRVTVAAALATALALGSQQVGATLGLPGWLIAVVSLALWTTVLAVVAPQWLRELLRTRISPYHLLRRTSPSSERELGRIEGDAADLASS